MCKQRFAGKPDESKTVLQWGWLSRIPVDGAKPSYIWDAGGRPTTIYYHERDTRAMTEAERSSFAADMKGYAARYLQMFERSWLKIKDGE